MTTTEIAAGKSGFRVLVVDDNKDAADSLSAVLRLWGYDVLVAYDGMTALDQTSTFLPHCLILDIGLPRLDGYALAQRLRAQPALRMAKLIALSAYSDPEHSRRTEAAGFDYRFVKPADLKEVKELLIMLQEVMQVAKETRELIQDTRDELKEVKEDIKEVKQDLKEIKEIVRNEREPDQAGE